MDGKIKLDASRTNRAEIYRALVPLDPKAYLFPRSENRLSQGIPPSCSSFSVGKEIPSEVRKNGREKSAVQMDGQQRSAFDTLRIDFGKQWMRNGERNRNGKWISGLPDGSRCPRFYDSAARDYGGSFRRCTRAIPGPTLLLYVGTGRDWIGWDGMGWDGTHRAATTRQYRAFTDCSVRHSNNIRGDTPCIRYAARRRSAALPRTVPQRLASAPASVLFV